MQQVVILVGTVTGTATMVAEELAERLKASGYAARMVPMERATLDTFREDALFLICTSTYGEGDVPHNASQLYSALQSNRPDLSGLRYGVFGLGDKLHHGATFCFGCKKFDALLSELGGIRLGPRGEHDSGSAVYAEDHAREWLKEWLQAIRTAAGGLRQMTGSRC